MKTLLKNGAMVLLATAALTACDKSKDAPETDLATKPDVEAAAVVIDAGSIKAAVVVEKSTDESESVFVVFSQAKTLTAKVVDINHETREVVLMGEKGGQLSFIASEDTKNLDQVTPGDTVHAKHVRRATVRLVEGQELKPSVSRLDVTASAKEGEAPAMLEKETTVKVYTVESIDVEKNTFSLKNAKGEVEEFNAKDPKRLERASVGDSVVLTIVEALAVEVVKAEEKDAS